MSKFGKVQKCRVLNPKTAHKQAQARLQARGISEPMNQKIGVVVLGTSVNKYNRPESWKVNAIPDVTPWSNQKINSRGEHLRSGRSRSVYYNNWNMLAPIGASI